MGVFARIKEGRKVAEAGWVKGVGVRGGRGVAEDTFMPELLRDE